MRRAGRRGGAGAAGAAGLLPAQGGALPEAPLQEARVGFGAFCLDVTTLAFCQLMGFPLTTKSEIVSRGAESNRVGMRLGM